MSMDWPNRQIGAEDNKQLELSTGEADLQICEVMQSGDIMPWGQ